jgi:transposase
VEAIDHVLTEHRVAEVLSVAWEKQVERNTHYVGRGRGAASRKKREIAALRSHITHIARRGENLAEITKRFGWKAFVTNAVQARLSWEAAVLCSRKGYRVERIFHRLQSRVHLAPLFVKLHDHIEGLTYLLTFGIRV